MVLKMSMQIRSDAARGRQVKRGVRRTTHVTTTEVSRQSLRASGAKNFLGPAGRQGLSREFIDDVRAAYERIPDGPFKYQELRSGIRRAITRRFPYGIYFTVEDHVIFVIAVLDTARDPAEWQLLV